MLDFDGNISSDLLRSKLQLFLVQKLKLIQSNKRSENLKQVIQIVEFFLGLTESNNEIETNFEQFSQNLLQLEFRRSFYSLAFREILLNFNPELIESTSLKSSICQIMFNGNHIDSFLIIHELLTSLKFVLFF